MKILTSLRLLLVVFMLTSASVYSGDAPSIAPIGDWEVEKLHASGAIIKVQMKIEEGGLFSGFLLVNGDVNWEFSGDWKMSGDELTYTYTKSSKPLPKNYKDTDVILSISELSFDYESKLTGEKNTYTRVK